MANAGEFLEIMMANIQAHLGPAGVDVRLREKFYNPQSGKQIGEIDITVRGEFGTSKFFIGIECRDRPADGPQGLPWIREVVGKKQQLKPDKMIAASSTGFTDDAIEFAMSENIDLITISEPALPILKEWFEILGIAYRDWHLVTTGITIKLVDPTREPPAEALQFSTRNAVFTMPPFDMRPRSLDSLVIEKVQEQLAGFSSDDSVRGKLVIPSPLSINIDGQTYPLLNAIAEIELTPHTEYIRVLLNAYHRLSDDKTIALGGKATISLKGKDMVIMVVAKKDGSRRDAMSIKVHFYDHKGNETLCPKGLSWECDVTTESKKDVIDLLVVRRIHYSSRLALPAGPSGRRPRRPVRREPAVSIRVQGNLSQCKRQARLSMASIRPKCAINVPKLSFVAISALNQPVGRRS